MARLVSSKIHDNMTITMNTKLTDGTISTKDFQINDIIENLRYIENEEIVTVSGKLYGIELKVLRGAKVPNSSKLVNEFGRFVKVTGLYLDASEQYDANALYIETKNILEDEGVSDVENVYFTVDMTATMSFEYSDETENEIEIIPGKALKNAVIKTGKPGEKNLEGDFSIGYFIYSMISPVPNEDDENGGLKTVGLALVYKKKPMVVTYDQIISVEEVGEDTSSDDEKDIPTVQADSTESFIELLQTVEPGTKIVVTSDVDITESINVAEGSDITIDFGENELKVPEAVNGRSLYAIYNHGKLTIDGLKVSARGIQNEEDGELIINDIDITDRDANGGSCVWNIGKLTINGGTYTTGTEATASTGPGCVNNHGGEITINGGTFTAPNPRCYAIINYKGDMVVNGDINVSGTHGGISCDGGTLTINGGTYHSDNYYGLYVSTDGVRPDGTASVVVNGGDFEGPNSSVYVGSDSGLVVEASVRINGGTFRKKLSVQNNVSEIGGIKIYGGNFNEQVPEAYLPEGYTATNTADNNGWYTVVKNA